VTTPSSESFTVVAARGPIEQDHPMALGVDGMRARRVIVKAVLLTLGTLVFVVCVTMVYKSMRHARRPARARHAR
jgi:hypothetical protein